MKNNATLYGTVKTDDQENANSNDPVVIIEPIRESVVVYVIKIAFVLIIIEISALGGYTDQVTLSGVSNPQQYEKMLRRHF